MAKEGNGGWTKTEILGIVLVALGVAFLAYSIYNAVSPPTMFVHAGNFTGRGLNGTTSGYNGFGGYSGAGRGFAVTFQLGDIFSGILLIALGAVTYKYGALKREMHNRK